MERERKAKLQVERQIEERQKKVEEQRRKEEQKRLAVEEKRKQKQEEEKVSVLMLSSFHCCRLNRLSHTVACY